MSRFLLSLSLAALAATPLRALDLTPQQTTRELEGIRIPILRFRDGPRRVTYQPPADWRVSGTGRLLQLTPGSLEQALVVLRLEERPAPPKVEPVPAEAAEEFEQWARRLLPPQATHIERVGESANRFTLGPASSRELLFTYTSPAGRFSAAIAAVDLDERERLAVIVTVRREAFARLHEEAIASLFSWQWGDE